MTWERPEGNDYWHLKFIRNHKSVFLDKTLWIDGGEILPLSVANWSNSSTESQYMLNPYIFSLDLSEPTWISGDRRNDDIDSLYSAGRLKVWEKDGGGYSTGGALFHYKWSNEPPEDPNTSRYLQFGGRTQPVVKGTSDAPYIYDAKNKVLIDFKMKAKDLTKDQNGYFDPHHGASAQSLDGMAYYLGGMDQYGTVLKQLVTIDLTEGTTTVEDIGEMPAIMGSQMTWFPINKKGILVSVGGETIGNNGRRASVPMEEIWIYDILSKKWFTQLATSADPEVGVPIDRKHHCAVAPSYSETQESYEIIVHAGVRPVSTSRFRLDDMWSLTVPSFQWVNYFYGTTGRTDNWGGYNVSCAIPNDRYFMVVSTHGFGQEFEKTPFGYFNLETVSWGDFDPNAVGYKRPTIIRTATNGKTAPAQWDDPELETIFAEVYTRGYSEPSTTTTSLPTRTGGPTSSETSAPGGNDSKNTAAIAAGASVGGIAVIAFAVFIWWWLRQKKRNLPQIPYIVPPYKYENAHGYDPDERLQYPELSAIRPRQELPGIIPAAEVEAGTVGHHYHPIKPSSMEDLKSTEKNHSEQHTYIVGRQ